MVSSEVIVDRVTTSYLKAFQQEQSLPDSIDQSVLFEHFVNYCLVTEAYDEEFDIEVVHTGGGNDLAIDGLAIFINGVLVDSVDAAEELLALNGYLDVRFIFNQAKSASNFSGEEMVAFKDGVKEFFSENLSLPASARIVEFRAVMTWVYEHSSAFKNGSPHLELNYVTTGLWTNDAALTTKIGRIIEELTALNVFGKVVFNAHGAAAIQGSWSKSKNAVKAEFQFVKRATLAEIPGVSQSYLGVLPVSEFLHVVADEESGVRRHIFIDNVRDFQGDNPVNGEMAASLATQEGRDRFAVLNNGVTLVARQLRIVGDKFHVADYQIVNGCQTSHVLYNNRELLGDGLQIPFKVIATDDEEVISSIAKATNRQTHVSEEDLYALETFQKNLESHFEAFEERQRLYYERRSKQFASATGIEKVRIITKPLEIRAFGAMFLNDPHRAARYYAVLKAQVGSTIFNGNHKLDPYYTAAFAYYKLEFLFRNGLLQVSYKPARYALLLAFRVLAAGWEMPALSANRIETYSKKINEALWDDAKALRIFKAACDVIDTALDGDVLDGDAVKVQAFTDSVIAALRK